MWEFNGKVFDVPIEEINAEGYVGFVYKITNLDNGMIYIGKKNFFSHRKLKPTDKRRKTVESDWKKYYGSSANIKEDVKAMGKDRFKREIIYLCKTLRALTYYEMKLQFEHDVILKDNYYNDNIAGKFFASDARHITSAVKSPLTGLVEELDTDS